jgi:hypothetical protein
MASAAFTDAYVRYLTQFPTRESLGEGNPPAAWKAELDAVDPLAFDQIKATSLSFEGGNMAGVSNFEQMQKVRALHAVRAKRDPSYVNPYTEEIPEPMRGKRIGSIVRQGY